MFQTEKFHFPVRKCQEKFVVDMTTSAFPALLKGKRGAPVTSSIVLNVVIEDLGFSFRKPGGSSPKAPDGGALAQTSAPGMEEPPPDAMGWTCHNLIQEDIWKPSGSHLDPKSAAGKRKVKQVTERRLSQNTAEFVFHSNVS